MTLARYTHRHAAPHTTPHSALHTIRRSRVATAAGLAAVKGNMRKKAELTAAIERARIASPRGAVTFSKAHNPVQDLYLRQVVGKENKLVGVASKALTDPARGCKL